MESAIDPIANQQAVQQAVEFAGFRVDARQRQLFDSQGTALPLSSRAFDTLVYLCEHRGETLSKQQLLEAVWPNSVVEENNLNQAISALRKVLGDNQGKPRIILTIPGRGYCFVPEVRPVPEPTDQVAAVPMSPRALSSYIPRPAMLWTLLAVGSALLLSSLYNLQRNAGSAARLADSANVAVQAGGAVGGTAGWTESADEGPPLAIDGTPTALRALGADLLPADIQQLDGVPTPSQEAWQAYLSGTTALVPGNYAEALRWFERAVKIDPGFKEAQVSLSMLHTLMTGVPVSTATEHREQALVAARQALAIDPAFGYAHAVLGAAQHNNAQWERAADEYRLAREFGADVDNMEMNALLQLSLGDFNSAGAMLRTTLKQNPANLNARGFLMVTEELLGNRQASEQAYQQGEAMYARSWWGDITGVWLSLGRNDSAYIEKMRAEYPTYALYPVLQVFEDRDTAVSRLRLISQDGARRPPAQLLNAAMFAAWYDEHQLALDLLNAGFANNWISLYILWLPVFDDLRKQAGFKDLLRASGIIDYWQRNGWSEVCKPLPGNDFECGWRAYW